LEAKPRAVQALPRPNTVPKSRARIALLSTPVERREPMDDGIVALAYFILALHYIVKAFG
jgi:hypothetical protein